MFKQSIAAIALGLPAILAHADTFKSDKEILPFVDSVMQKVVADDFNGAFKLMQPYSITISEEEIQIALINTKSQSKLLFGRYGFATGHELVEQKKVGDSLVRVVEILKTEKSALPWVFYFYKTPQGWVLHSFKWNDQIPPLFDGR